MQDRLTSWIGPVFVREMVEISRKRQTYVLRMAYGFMLLGVISLAWDSAITDPYGEQGIRRMAYLSRAVFNDLGLFQLFAVHLLVPPLVINAISGERQRGTLDLLLIADLDDREIVFGKLASRLLPILLIVLSIAPIYVALSLFGGVSIGLALILEWWTLLCIVLVGSLAIFCSTQQDWLAALLRCYSFVGAFGLSQMFATILFIDAPFFGLTMVSVVVFVLSRWLLQLATNSIRPVRRIPRLPEPLPVTSIRETVESQGRSEKPRAVRPFKEWLTELRVFCRVILYGLTGHVIFVLFIAFYMSSLLNGPSAAGGFWLIAFLTLLLVAASNPLLTHRPGFFDDLMMTPLTNGELLRGLLAVNRPWVQWVGIGMALILAPFLIIHPFSTLANAAVGFILGFFVVLATTVCNLAATRASTRIWPPVALMLGLVVVPYWMPAALDEAGVLGHFLFAIVAGAICLWTRISAPTSLRVALHLGALYFLIVSTVVTLPLAILPSDWSKYKGKLPSPATYLWEHYSPWCYLVSEDSDAWTGVFLYSIALLLTCVATWMWGVRSLDRLVGRVSEAERQKL